MAIPCLWASRTAKCLKICVFRRGFSSVVKYSQYVSAREEVEVEGDSHGKEISSPKKNKAIISSLKRLHDEDGIWTVGSMIYMVDEIKDRYTSSGTLPKPKGGIIFKVHGEKGTIIGGVGFDVNGDQEYRKMIRTD